MTVLVPVPNNKTKIVNCVYHLYPKHEFQFLVMFLYDNNHKFNHIQFIVSPSIMSSYADSFLSIQWNPIC